MQKRHTPSPCFSMGQSDAFRLPISLIVRQMYWITSCYTKLLIVMQNFSNKTIFRKFVISIIAFAAFILIFATIYTFFLSDDFLFTTAVKEPAYRKTVVDSEKIIKSRLSQAVRDHCSATNPRGKKLLGDEKLVKALETQYLTEDIELNFVGKEGASLRYRNIVYGKHYLVGDCEVTEFSYTGRSFQKGDYLISCQYRGNDIDMNGNASISIVAPASTSEFKNLLYPERGLRNNLFARMAYFSTVTATTLGYGEIIPLTNSARIWVALESIFGLILMGCIVYWITRQP